MYILGEKFDTSNEAALISKCDAKTTEAEKEAANRAFQKAKERFLDRQKQYLFLFTYRYFKQPLEQEGHKATYQDTNWGCSIRCAQMLFSTILQNIHGVGNNTRTQIISLFLDKPHEKNHPYSIHNICKKGKVKFNASINKYWEPSTAMMSIAELYKERAAKTNSWPEGKTQIHFFGSNVLDFSKLNKVNFDFSQTVMLIGMFGQDTVTDSNSAAFFDCCEMSFFKGMIGGIKSRALMVIGLQCDTNNFMVLDPHYVNDEVDEPLTKENIESYSCKDKIKLKSIKDFIPYFCISFVMTGKKALLDFAKAYVDLTAKYPDSWFYYSKYEEFLKAHQDLTPVPQEGFTNSFSFCPEDKVEALKSSFVYSDQNRSSMIIDNTEESLKNNRKEQYSNVARQSKRIGNTEQTESKPSKPALIAKKADLGLSEGASQSQIDQGILQANFGSFSKKQKKEDPTIQARLDLGPQPKSRIKGDPKKDGSSNQERQPSDKEKAEEVLFSAQSKNNQNLVQTEEKTSSAAEIDEFFILPHPNEQKANKESGKNPLSKTFISPPTNLPQNCKHSSSFVAGENKSGRPNPFSPFSNQPNLFQRARVDKTENRELKPTAAARTDNLQESCLLNDFKLA